MKREQKRVKCFHSRCIIIGSDHHYLYAENIELTGSDYVH